MNCERHSFKFLGVFPVRETEYLIIMHETCLNSLADIQYALPAHSSSIY